MVVTVFVGLLSGASDDNVLLIAWSLLDFIYYAQFQQHGQDSCGHAGQPESVPHT